MKRLIATLPLSPRQNPVLGYCLSAFTVYLFGKMTGLNSLVALNTKGTKGWSMNDADRFTHILSRIVETPFDVWHDEKQSWNSILSFFTSRGLHEGWLSIEEREIYCCDCGKTEFLPEPLNLIQNDFRRKAYEIRDGNIQCRLCGMKADLKQTNCLLMLIPKDLVQVECFPNYAQLEWNGLLRQLCGCRLLISRTRDTGMSVQIGLTKFFLDVDLCWMLMPSVLAEEGSKIETLVCGHKTLKHALLSIAVSQLMHAPMPSAIISVPYLHVRNSMQEEASAEKMLATYSAKAIRIFLAMALGGSGKEITLLEDNLRFSEYAVQRSIKMIPREEYFLIGSAWRSLGIQKMRRAVAQIRRGHADQLPLETKQILSILLRHVV